MSKMDNFMETMGGLVDAAGQEVSKDGNGWHGGIPEWA